LLVGFEFFNLFEEGAEKRGLGPGGAWDDGHKCLLLLAFWFWWVERGWEKGPERVLKPALKGPTGDPSMTREEPGGDPRMTRDGSCASLGERARAPIVICGC
jgi:hypothetical protein